MLERQSQQDDPREITAQFYDRVLSVVATTSVDRRFQAVADLVLEHAVRYLATTDAGIQLLVFQCLPSLVDDSTKTIITSLYVRLAIGTAPWRMQAHSSFPLHGAESLAGYAAKMVHPMVSQDIQRNPDHFPLRQEEHARSTAAYPLLQECRVAGCFQILSRLPNYFSPDRLDMLRRYADLLALAFHSHEFYDPQAIALYLMPPTDVQRPYLASFQQQVHTALRSAKARQQEMNVLLAERQVLQEIEQKLRTLQEK
ncbi:hypothetical protein KDA_76080 [Dictyobacter alpinus]|uniref:GAF domain-containing protein n=1 Tax=Dictyobacter alpinus TaxID=2014873 RepID=A0A402BLA0_9CHLR|nr:hypothetical protein KDA_76080 [Dictyobacter alpinus]